MGEVLRAMKHLSPAAFENLSFDLLLLRGLKNATWRTPGADGGRDIEGTVSTTDLSGSVALQKWYVECKRYANSLDWPTVREKIAYAENHRADYLLICTTGLLSPRCKDEIQLREARGDRPGIRYWDGPSLENVVSQESVLLAKYSLSSSTEHIARSIVPAILLASKSIQAAYARASFGSGASNELALGAALIELLTIRISQLESGDLRFVPFDRAADLYPWTETTLGDSSLRAFDSYGLRALLAAVRFLSKSSVVKVRAYDAAANALQVDPTIIPNDTSEGLIRVITLWSNCECRLSPEGLVTAQARKAH